MPAIADPNRPPIHVDIASNEDVVFVRQRAREQSQRAGFSLLETTKLVTAASELARNTLEHGGGGHAVVGAISLGTEEVEKGRGIVKEIVAELSA